MFSPCAVNGPSHGKPFATPDRMLPRSLHRRRARLRLDRSNIAAKSGGFVSEGRALTPGSPLVRSGSGGCPRPPAVPENES
jgi:hypothetical protein